MEAGDAMMYMIVKMADLGMQGGMAAIKATGKASAAALSAIATLGIKAGDLLFWEKKIGQQMQHGTIDTLIYFLPDNAVETFKWKMHQAGVPCRFIKLSESDPTMVLSRPSDANKIKAILGLDPDCHMEQIFTTPYDAPVVTMDEMRKKTVADLEVPEQSNVVSEPVALPEEEKKEPINEQEQAVSQEAIEEENAAPGVAPPENEAYFTGAENLGNDKDEEFPDRNEVFPGEAGRPVVPGEMMSEKSSEIKASSPPTNSSPEKQDIDLSMGVIAALKQAEALVSQTKDELLPDLNKGAR